MYFMFNVLSEPCFLRLTPTDPLLSRRWALPLVLWSMVSEIMSTSFYTFQFSKIVLYSLQRLLETAASLRQLFSASVELTRDFCEQLDSLVGPQLTLLASDICEQFTINRRISGSVAKPSPLIMGLFFFIFFIFIFFFVFGPQDKSCSTITISKQPL